MNHKACALREDPRALKPVRQACDEPHAVPVAGKGPVKAQDPAQRKAAADQFCNSRLFQRFEAIDLIGDLPGERERTDTR